MLSALCYFPPVRPSVCLSVTRVDQLKTVEVKMQFSPYPRNLWQWHCHAMSHISPFLKHVTIEMIGLRPNAPSSNCLGFSPRPWESGGWLGFGILPWNLGGFYYREWNKILSVILTAETANLDFGQTSRILTCTELKGHSFVLVSGYVC